MNTINSHVSRTDFERETFSKILKKIKACGFNVYVPKDFETEIDFNSAYVVALDGKRFISAELESILACGVKFASVNRPCEESGTGFRLSKYLTVEDINKELIDRFLNVIIPNWWNGSTPIPYRDFTDFRNSRDCWNELVEFKG